MDVGDDDATALDVIREQRADVVLMDVRMPGMHNIKTSVGKDNPLMGPALSGQDFL